MGIKSGGASPELANKEYAPTPLREISTLADYHGLFSRTLSLLPDSYGTVGFAMVGMPDDPASKGPRRLPSPFCPDQCWIQANGLGGEGTGQSHENMVLK